MHAGVLRSVHRYARRAIALVGFSSEQHTLLYVENASSPGAAGCVAQFMALRRILSDGWLAFLLKEGPVPLASAHRVCLPP